MEVRTGRAGQGRAGHRLSDYGRESADTLYAPRPARERGGSGGGDIVLLKGDYALLGETESLRNPCLRGRFLLRETTKQVSENNFCFFLLLGFSSFIRSV